MQAKSMNSDISGDELRKRIKRLGITYTLAAERLGLSLDGLNKQMRGDHPVSRQTTIILDFLEKEASAQRPPRHTEKPTARPRQDATRPRQVLE